MAVLVLPTSSFVTQQLDALRTLAPHEIFHTEPQSAPAAEIEAILAFKLREGIATRFPNLRFIACAGAGADDLLAVGDLPPVPVVRPVDPLQAQRIAQYVTLMVLRFHRDLARLEMQHREARWERFMPPDEAQTTIGVLGFGASGKAIARALMVLGFTVRAWRRSRHEEESPRIEVLTGREQLAQVLASSRVLVCTLPLTRETRGLIDRAALECLPSGACVIDVSRGGVVDHQALWHRVQDNRITGAALDVYPEEPLAASSPLWRHPRILCTPHIAGTPRAHVAASQFLDNLDRARRGEPLVNEVDRGRGY